MTKKFGLGLEHELLFEETGSSSYNQHHIQQLEKLRKMSKYPNGKKQPSGDYTDRSQYEYEVLRGTSQNSHGYIKNPDDETIGKIENDLSLEGITEISSSMFRNKTVEEVVDMVRTVRNEAEHVSNSKQYPLPTIKGRIDEGNPQTRDGRKNVHEAGSYHVTITLPYDKNRDSVTEHAEETRKFVKMIQWLEPLIISCYGGGNYQSIGDGQNFPQNPLHSEGSYRQMGEWGLIGYSNPDDLRVGSSESRYPRNSNRTPEFRKNGKLSEHESHRQMFLGGDLRWGEERHSDSRSYTGFGFGDNYKEGVEIRFLDSFSDVAIDDVIKTFIYIAQCSVNNQEIENVNDKSNWQKTAEKVMFEGWNAYIPQSYIDDTRYFTGLPIQTYSQRAEDILRQITYELWYKYSSGEIPKLMISNNKQPPEVYNFSKDVWNYYFMNEFSQEQIEQLEDLIDDEEDFDSFKQKIENHFGRKYALEETRDILDFLEFFEFISITRFSDGSIKSYEKTDKNPEYLSDDITDKGDEYTHRNNKDNTLNKLFQYTHTGKVNVNKEQLTEKQIHKYTKAIIDYMKQSNFATVPQLYESLKNTHPDVAKHNIRYILNEKLSPDYVNRYDRQGRAIVWKFIQTPPSEMMGIQKRVSINPQNSTPTNDTHSMTYLMNNNHRRFTYEELAEELNKDEHDVRHELSQFNTSFTQFYIMGENQAQVKLQYYNQERPNPDLEEENSFAIKFDNENLILRKAFYENDGLKYHHISPENGVRARYETYSDFLKLLVLSKNIKNITDTIVYKGIDEIIDELNDNVSYTNFHDERNIIESYLFEFVANDILLLGMSDNDESVFKYNSEWENGRFNTTETEPNTSEIEDNGIGIEDIMNEERLETLINNMLDYNVGNDGEAFINYLQLKNQFIYIIHTETEYSRDDVDDNYIFKLLNDLYNKNKIYLINNKITFRNGEYQLSVQNEPVRNQLLISIPIISTDSIIEDYYFITEPMAQVNTVFIYKCENGIEYILNSNEREWERMDEDSSGQDSVYDNISHEDNLLSTIEEMMNDQLARSNSYIEYDDLIFEYMNYYEENIEENHILKLLNNLYRKGEIYLINNNIEIVNGQYTLNTDRKLLISDTSINIHTIFEDCEEVCDDDTIFIYKCVDDIEYVIYNYDWAWRRLSDDNNTSDEQVNDETLKNFLEDKIMSMYHNHDERYKYGIYLSVLKEMVRENFTIDDNDVSGIVNLLDELVEDGKIIEKTIEDRDEGRTEMKFKYLPNTLYLLQNPSEIFESREYNRDESIRVYARVVNNGMKYTSPHQPYWVYGSINEDEIEITDEEVNNIVHHRIQSSYMEMNSGISQIDVCGFLSDIYGYDVNNIFIQQKADEVINSLYENERIVLKMRINNSDESTVMLCYPYIDEIVESPRRIFRHDDYDMVEEGTQKIFIKRKLNGNDLYATPLSTNWNNEPIFTTTQNIENMKEGIFIDVRNRYLFMDGYQYGVDKSDFQTIVQSYIMEYEQTTISTQERIEQIIEDLFRSGKIIKKYYNFTNGDTLIDSNEYILPSIPETENNPQEIFSTNETNDMDSNPNILVYAKRQSIGQVEYTHPFTHNWMDIMRFNEHIENLQQRDNDRFDDTNTHQQKMISQTQENDIRMMLNKSDIDKEDIIYINHGYDIEEDETSIQRIVNNHSKSQLIDMLIDDIQNGDVSIKTINERMEDVGIFI